MSQPTDNQQNFRAGSPWLLLSIFLIPIGLAIAPVVSFFYGLKIYMFGGELQGHRDHPPSETYTFQPKQSVWSSIVSGIKTVFSVVLFPLYLCRIGLSALLQPVIYPGDNESYWDAFGLKYNRVGIDMPDGVRLYTVEHTKHYSTTNDSDKPHIIWMGGNGASFECYNNEIAACAKRLDAKIIGFHHGHFGQSGFERGNNTFQNRSFTSKSILLEEGIAQVQRLLDKGIAPNQITLYGHSMGGGIASLVAAHYHHQNIPVKIFNDRSFSSLSNFAKGWLLPDPKQPTNSTLAKIGLFFHKAVVTLLFMPVIKAVLSAADWEMDAGSAYHNIDDKYKDYAVVRAKRKDGNEGNYCNDEVIPYSASIHQAEKWAKPANEDGSKIKSDKDKKYRASRGFFAHLQEQSSLINRDGQRISNAVESLVTRAL